MNHGEEFATLAVTLNRNIWVDVRRPYGKLTPSKLVTASLRFLRNGKLFCVNTEQGKLLQEDFSFVQSSHVSM